MVQVEGDELWQTPEGPLADRRQVVVAQIKELEPQKLDCSDVFICLVWKREIESDIERDIERKKDNRKNI